MFNGFTFVEGLAKLTYAKWYVRHNHIKTKGFDKKLFKKGSFLILSNHCGFYDPIIISCVFPRLIRWVTGAYLFKTRFKNWVFAKVCKCIAKQQGQSDFATVREMQRALKEGDVVGIFPEGTRTWDGDMMPYSSKSLAKMIRSFSCNTVIVNLEGCFAQQPRWADHYRHGQGIVVNFKKLITKEEIADMKLEELENTIRENLDFSNDEWKASNDYNFISDNRAEGIQRLFYMCPVCGKTGTIMAEGNDFECTVCHNKVHVTEKDNLESETVKFTSFVQWHKWEAQNIINVKSFPKEKGVLLQEGPEDNNGDLETLSEDIEVFLENECLNIKYADKALKFELENISSLILNAKQTMEFVYDKKIYRVRLLPNASSLKYHEYYLACKEGLEK